MRYNNHNMNNNDKEEKVFNITHKMELLFWLLIILVVVATTSLTSINKEKNDENDYQIFLQDVDGLIVGSPVRMMGIEIGHVTKIKPTNDEMYVKFVITNPDVYIPQGTFVTVEFFGMAGSKSLELYLPNDKSIIDKSTPLITANPPKRLHDALGLLNDMYKKLTSIIYTTSSFGGEINKIDLPKSNTNFNDFVDYSDKFVNNAKQKTDEIHKLIIKGEKHGK